MNGFLNINKPSGISSSSVVVAIRHKLGKDIKVGHLGTLDPMASGVLPIAIGRATRLFDLLLKKNKTYIATFKFGYETDTLDAMGSIIRNTDNVPNIDNIRNVLGSFIGKNNQIPPQYSAKSVNGQRAYDIARNGGSIELKPCEIYIYKFELIKQFDSQTFEFLIECSAGTYIRSICRDLAYKLDTLGTMVSLIRTKSGMFDIENSIQYDSFNEKNLIPIEYVLKDFQTLNISDIDLKTILDGKPFRIDVLDGIYKVYSNDILQGIFEIENKSINKKIWLK